MGLIFLKFVFSMLQSIPFCHELHKFFTNFKQIGSRAFVKFVAFASSQKNQHKKLKSCF
jgi:hypothetical protein